MLNLFRREGETPLCCILPDGARVPSFLTGEGWRYLGKAASDDALPSALLDPERAISALRAVGYALVEAEARTPRSETSPGVQETNLDALLADPLVRLVMARDGADEAGVRAIARAARERMELEQVS